MLRKTFFCGGPGGCFYGLKGDTIPNSSQLSLLASYFQFFPLMVEEELHDNDRLLSPPIPLELNN